MKRSEGSQGALPLSIDCPPLPPSPPHRILWAVGLLASGQVATISLTYAGQLVMTGLLGLKVWGGFTLKLWMVRCCLSAGQLVMTGLLGLTVWGDSHSKCGWCDAVYRRDSWS